MPVCSCRSSSRTKQALSLPARQGEHAFPWLNSLDQLQSSSQHLLFDVQLHQSRISANLHSQNSAKAASVVSVPVEQLSDSERQQVAHQYGYSRIGKTLPDGVTLSQIVKSMPSQVVHRFAVACYHALKVRYIVIGVLTTLWLRTGI